MSSANKIFEKVAGAPADVLDKTIDVSKGLANTFGTGKHLQTAKDYWHTLGPGLTTGAADDDPSGIGTYSQTGAQYGFQLLWLAPFTFPLMAVVQEMCARIGLVTGRGLAANIRKFYPRWVLYSCTALLFLANTFNIGADLGAMAKGVQLILPQFNFINLVLFFALFSLALQIFTDYSSYAKYLKWLALILISYIFATLAIKDLDWNQIFLHAVIPSITFSKDQIFLITGVLGTTISPYLFFWQTSQEVEEEILAGKTTLHLRQGTTSEQVKNMRIDIWSGMFLSNLVMFFIIAACGAILFNGTPVAISTAADAASALKPIAGDQAYLLFALGIVGTGMLAVPVLAGSASYALSESFGWKLGLYRKLKEANAFYGVIIIATMVGLGIDLLGFDPIKALIYSAVANGVIAPVILVLIVMMSSSKKIMGEWKSHPFFSVTGWVITILMAVAGVATIIALI